MFKKMIPFALTLSVLIYPAHFAWANDPLLLTDAEMQKLKQYFPNSDLPPPNEKEKGSSASSKNVDSAVTTTTTPSESEGESTLTSNAELEPTMTEGDTYVALTRYAWQQLYAPTRFLKNPLGMTRSAMQTDSLQSSLVYGDKMIAHPLASWSLNHVYITAVSLRNQYPHATSIRVPQDLCGHWVAAVLYPRAQLSASGNKNSDSTTLFLLSREPFNLATEICHVSP